MPLQKSWSNHLTTPIPTTTDPAAIVRILHDHGFLITMSPIVTRYEQDPVDPSQQPTAESAAAPPSESDGPRIPYTVWETITFVPGVSVAKKEISFKASFQNREDGVVTWIRAPMGVESRAEYCVRKDENGETTKETSGGGGLGGWILEEKIESSCSMFLKGFVEKTMVATRKEMHGRILGEAVKRVAA